MKKCFIISPIGKKGSLTRKRYEQVVERAIRPALQACQYEAIRPDTIPTSGVITHEIIDHLLNDDLVIADLTERNPNVTYELGIRHAFRKPVIQIKDESDKLPFDIQGIRTIDFDYRFLESLENCKNQIIAYINNIDSGDPAKVQSPINMVIYLQSVGKDEAQSKVNKEILSQLQSIKSEIYELQGVVYNQFGGPEPSPDTIEESAPEDHDPGEPPEDHDPGEPPEDHDPGEPPEDHDPGEPPEDHDPGEPPEDHDPGEPPEDHDNEP